MYEQLTPAAGVIGLLLGLIFQYQVQQQHGWPELALPNAKPVHQGVIQFFQNWKATGGNSAYYVDYSPTKLTTIAQLTGKVIPYLTSAIMALVAFFASRQIIEASKDRESKDLPTPQQLTLLIALLSGSNFQPLVDTSKYWWMKRERLARPLRYAFAALLCVTVVGTMVPVADIWLGATVQVDAITQLVTESSPSYFGRSINETTCPPSVANVTTGLPCNIEHIGTGSDTHYDLAGATESCMTVNQVSDLNVVRSYTSDGQTYYYFLTAAAADLTRDFRTNTLALSTQCQPMTQKCFPGAQQNPHNFTVPNPPIFTCTPGFSADVRWNGALPVSNREEFLTPAVGIGFSPDAQLSRMIGVNGSEIVYASYQNPLYFGAWAIGYPSASPDEPLSLLSDPEVLADQFKDYVWLLNCSTTIYDVTYSWVNGTVYNFTTTIAAPWKGALVSAPLTMGIHMAQLALGLTSTMAGFQTDADQLSMMWAQLFSSYNVAVMAGAMQETENHLEQLRNNTVAVTRVPLVPLYVLIGFKCLYAVAALVLAGAAVCFTNVAETQSIKERLSVKGLATAYFADGPSQQAVAVKNVEDLFQEPNKSDPAQEPKKVAMVPTEAGGWQFVTMIANRVYAQVAPQIESVYVKPLLSEAQAGKFGQEAKDGVDVYKLLES